MGVANIEFMALDGRTKLLTLARIWAFPLWWWAMRSVSAEAMREDVDWWAKCIDNEELISLDPFSKFAYFTGALSEFRTLVHYRIQDLPLVVRLALKMVYRPPEHMILAADSIGPGFFIQHGHGMLIGATTIGHHCWINQDVTVGYMDKGNPTLGNNVRIAPGAVILGPITLHDGATIGPNAVVTRDVAAGEILVGPLAQPVKRKPQVDDERE